MRVLVRAESVEKHWGNRPLFRGISLLVHEGARVGLLGPNGAGKSTLLRILAGIETPDAGVLEWAKGARVGYVAQEDVLEDGATVEGVLLDAMGDLPAAEHERTTRARVWMGKLGFESGAARVEELSGGWRKRLAIARELMREPDLLLMDEPTNHLDLGGLVWLERFLVRAGFAFVVTSHDRYFLEHVTNRVTELNPRYGGGFFGVAGKYSDFLEKRAGMFAAQEKQARSLAAEVRREVEWLRSGPKARTTKADYRVQSAHRKIADLADVRRRIASDSSLDIDFAGTGRRSNDLLLGTGLAKAMGGRTLFRDLDVALSPGARLGILGNNGSGKTTLLRVLAGETPPDAGRIKRVAGLRVAVFDQKREQLDRSASLRRTLAPTGDAVTFQGRPLHVAAWAQRFLFSGDQLDVPVGDLSGGEQARAIIARMMLCPADVLMLDEPTNDLDIPAIEVLEKALLDFAGAIVVITHDRHLLERVCTDLVGLHGTSCGRYTDLSQWQAAEDRLVKAVAAKSAEGKEAKRQRTRSAPALTREERRELNGIEDRIHASEAELALLRQTLQDPTLAANHARLEQRCQQVHDAEVRVESMYRRWEELEKKVSG